MRVCLASLHPRRLSGQIESLTALACALGQRGHETRLVTAFDEDLLHDALSGAAQAEAGASACGKVACMVKSAARLARMGAWADVVHLNLPTPSFSLAADLLRWRLGDGPPVVVGYEAQLTDVSRLLRGDYLRRAPRFYLPLLLANNRLWAGFAPFGCRRYVVASETQREELRSLGVPDARLAVIPNLIGVEKLRRVDRAAARRAMFGEAVDGPLVGWCGHYHDIKGVATLLRAFSLLVMTDPDVRLVLAWSGIGDARPVEAEVRRLGLERQVIRLGRVEVGPFLSALDVAALPYRLTLGQGALPNMVLEVLAVGVPLVTSDLPMLREILEQGRTALLTPPDDASALAAGLRRLLADRAAAEAMAQQQRALMAGPLGPLSTARLAERYERLYLEVLSEHGAPGPSREPATTT